MKNAREGIDTGARRGNHCAAEWQGGRSHTAEQLTDQIDVHFLEKSHWDLPLKVAEGPAFRTAHRRVLTLSQYAGVAQPESQFDTGWVRKLASAIVRARAT